MLESILETGAAFRTMVFFAGLVWLVGVSAHAITWLITRRGAARWVWGYWNAVGVVLLALGVGAIGYGWLCPGASDHRG